MGNSGSGKTHLARRLAARLDLPHIELDSLNHLPGWTEAPVPDFRAALSDALADSERRLGGWVVDGNYRSRVADLLTPEVYVWLDYPRLLVLRRVVRRTLGRVLLRRELWNGNRERWANLFRLDPQQSVIRWSWTQHSKYVEMYTAAAAVDTGAAWVRLRHPRDTERWLSTVERRPAS